MRIGIDVDDVLADFNRAFVEFHNRYYGTAITAVQLDRWNYWEVWGGSKEAFIGRYKMFCENGHLSSLQPVPGAQNAVALLASSHKISVISARPSYTHAATREWLREYFPCLVNSIHFSRQWEDEHDKKKKSHLCADAGIEVMIEDAPPHAEDCVSVCRKVLLFDRPWNQSHSLPEKMVRVYGWHDVVKECMNGETG